MTQDIIQVNTLRLLSDMQCNIRSRNSDSSNGKGGGIGNGGNNGGSNGMRCQKRKTSDNATFERYITNKYCWTHRGWTHTSTECTRQ